MEVQMGMGHYHVGDEPVPGYRLVEYLGRGEFGCVWKATNPGQFEVALKIIDLSKTGGYKELRSVRWIRLEGINHPNLCPIHNSWLKDGKGSWPEAEDPPPDREPAELIIDMGLGDDTLAHRLEVRQAEHHAGIPIGELLDYLEGAARGIDYLNLPVTRTASTEVLQARRKDSNERHKIHHGDIKPTNILAVADVAQVCDFGLVKPVGDIRKTQLALTPVYASPEVIDGRAPSPTSDQYSLAIVYFELRTGRLPFKSEKPTLTEIFRAKAEGTLELSGLPLAERRVIERATAAEPGDRFASCLDLIHELRRAAQQQEEQEPEPPPWKKLGPYQASDEPVPGYKLIEFLGHGQFGAVWKATSPGGIEVALKVIDLSQPSAPKELRALGLIQLKGLRNPHLCPLLAFWRKDADGNILHDTREESGLTADAAGVTPTVPQPAGQSELGSAARPAAHPRSPNVTLDLSGRDTDRADRDPTSPSPDAPGDGQRAELIIAMGLGDDTLADRLEACKGDGFKGVPFDELHDYIRDTAHGIDYLNRHEVYHGDIKPSNILRVGGAVQVCDFGLAKPVGDIRNTQLALTPAYASPEVIDGKPPSSTSDQYSLAILYFELRTGRLPFKSEKPTLTEILRAKTDGTLELSALPLAEQRVIQRATAAEPTDRFASCRDLVRELLRAAQQQEEPEFEPPPWRKLGPYQGGDEPVSGYKLIDELGRGQFGIVWKATSPGGIEVALKVIDLSEPGAPKELRALGLIKLKRLRNTHLCPILAFWRKDADGNILHDTEDESEPGADTTGVTPTVPQPAGQSELASDTRPTTQPDSTNATLNLPGLDTDRADLDDPTSPSPAASGEGQGAELIIAMGLGDDTLADRLEACTAGGLNSIPFDELHGYMRDSADGIDYLKEHNIYHGDIKPSNILRIGGAAQVCDFGLAKPVGDIRKTKVALTPVYASPEVMSEKAPNATSDQYSLAIVFFELRTGRLPFESENPTFAENLLTKMNGTLELSALPSAEQRVIARATSAEPGDRFPSCQEMVDALRRANEPVPAPPVPPSPAPLTRRLVNLATLIAAGLVIVGLVIAGFFWVNPWEQFEKELAANNYRHAYTLVPRFFLGDNRDKAKGQLKEAWLASTANLPPNEAWIERREILLHQFPQDKETLEVIAAAAWQRLDSEDLIARELSAAREQFKFIRDQLTESPPQWSEALVAEAQLGQISIAARQSQWTNVHRQLNELSIDTALSGQSAWPHYWLLKVLDKYEYDPKTAELAPSPALPGLDPKDPTEFLKDLTEGWKIPKFDLEQLKKDLDAWEWGQISELRERALPMLEPWISATAPSDLQLSGKDKSNLHWTRLWPGEIEPRMAEALLDQAQQKLTQDGFADFVACRKVLAKAADWTARVPEPEVQSQLKSRYDRLETCLDLRDPEISDEKALDRLKQYAANGADAGFDGLIKAAAGRAGRSRGFAGAAVQVLQRTPDPKSLTGNPDYAWLLAIRLIDLEEPTADDIEEFRTSLKAIDPPESASRLVYVCEAECLFEDNQEEEARRVMSDPDATQRGADTTSHSEELPERFADYVSYMKMLLQSSETDITRRCSSCERLIGLLNKEPQSPLLRISRRKQRIAAALIRVARQLRDVTDDDGINFMKPAYTGTHAAHAARYLDRAEKLQGLSTDSSKTLAIASFYRDPPDIDRVVRIIDSLLRERTDVSPRLRFINAIAHCQRCVTSDSTQDRDRAIECFGMLLRDLLWNVARDRDTKDQRAAREKYYEEIVKPAISLAEAIVRESRESSDKPLPELSKTLREALAIVYASRGELILNNYAVWEDVAEPGGPNNMKRDPFKVAYDDFKNSNGYLLDGQRKAAFYVGQGIALSGRDDIRPLEIVEELRQLADAALVVDGTCLKANALKGYACLLESRKDANRERRKEHLKDSLTLYGKAIQEGEEKRIQGSEMVPLLVGRSAAHLALGILYNDIKRTEHNEKERTKISNKCCEEIGLAEADARKATAQLTYAANPEDAWNALGNAQEDLALYCLDTRKYEDAIRAFQKAEDRSMSDLAKSMSMMNHGRCLFRQAKSSENTARAWEKLESARKVYEQGQLDRPRIKVKILYWLGVVSKEGALPESSARKAVSEMAAMKAIDKALDVLREAAHLAKTADPAVWPMYQMTCADNSLSASQEIGEPKDSSEIYWQKWRQTAVTSADEVREQAISASADSYDRAHYLRWSSIVLSEAWSKSERLAKMSELIDGVPTPMDEVLKLYLIELLLGRAEFLAMDARDQIENDVNAAETLMKSLDVGTRHPCVAARIDGVRGIEKSLAPGGAQGNRVKLLNESHDLLNRALELQSHRKRDSLEHSSKVFRRYLDKLSEYYWTTLAMNSVLLLKELKANNVNDPQEVREILSDLKAALRKIGQQSLAARWRAELNKLIGNWPLLKQLNLQLQSDIPRQPATRAARSGNGASGS